jgi:hypothetical protein
MGDGEIAFGELPAVDDVAIENEYVGSNALEVVNEFLGTASIGSQVYIGYDYYINGTFFHSCGFSKFYIRYYYCFKPLLTNCEFCVNTVLPCVENIPLRP